MGKNDVAKCGTDGNRIMVDDLVAALQRLVSLKKYQDIMGKDNYYMMEQCEAWAEAKKLLCLVAKDAER